LRVALERAILSLRRVIYLERPGCHVTLRCSRTRRSGMLRRFPVFSDAKQWVGQAFPRVREGARVACIVTGSGSRRRRCGMPCRWAVSWNPMHRVALPPCRKSRPRSGVGFQGYPEVGVVHARGNRSGSPTIPRRHGSPTTPQRRQRTRWFLGVVDWRHCQMRTGVSPLLRAATTSKRWRYLQLETVAHVDAKDDGRHSTNQRCFVSQHIPRWSARQEPKSITNARTDCP